MSTLFIPTRLFVYKVGEFTQLSILQGNTWTMFELRHCPTKRMVTWIENDPDFIPQGEEIPGLQSNGDMLLACLKLVDSVKEISMRFEALSEHFTEVPEAVIEDIGPPSVMSRHPERSDPPGYVPEF